METLGRIVGRWYLITAHYWVSEQDQKTVKTQFSEAKYSIHCEAQIISFLMTHNLSKFIEKWPGYDRTKLWYAALIRELSGQVSYRTFTRSLQCVTTWMHGFHSWWVQDAELREVTIQSPQDQLFLTLIIVYCTCVLRIFFAPISLH